MVKQWKTLNMLAEVVETAKIIASFMKMVGFKTPPTLQPKEIYNKYGE